MEINHLKGIGFGLTAAICWGLGDYVVTILARRVGTPRAMAFIQSFSLLCWIVLLLLPAQILWERDSVALWSGFSQKIGMWPAWAWMLMAGVCHVAGIALSYRAFEIGTLALVAPISSSFAIVTAVLSTATRETLPPPVMAGVSLLFLGIVLATRTTATPDDTNKGLKGVPEALGSALAYGVMFWMMLPGEQKLGPVLPLIVLKIMATLSALIGLSVASFRKNKTADVSFNAPDVSSEAPLQMGSPVLWIALALMVALLDSFAWLSYSAGDRTGSTTVVTALASLFSVVTILLAWLLFKDRLAKLQWLGIAIILAGVLLVAFK